MFVCGWESAKAQGEAEKFLKMMDRGVGQEGGEGTGRVRGEFTCGAVFEALSDQEI